MDELLKQILARLDGMATDVRDLKQGQRTLEQGQEGLDRMIQSLALGQRDIVARLDGLDQSFVRLETDMRDRMGAVEDGWNFNNAKLGLVAEQLDRVESKLDILNDRTIENEVDIQLLKKAK